MSIRPITLTIRLPSALHGWAESNPGYADVARMRRALQARHFGRFALRSPGNLGEQLARLGQSGHRNSLDSVGDRETPGPGIDNRDSGQA